MIVTRGFSSGGLVITRGFSSGIISYVPIFQYISSGATILSGITPYRITIYRNVIELHPGVLQKDWIFDSPTDSDIDGELGRVPVTGSQFEYSSSRSRIATFISSPKNELNIESESIKILSADSKLVASSLNDSDHAEVEPESDSKVEDEFEGESGTKKILAGTSSTN